MTTWYFDWDGGNDANSGTSESTPKQSYDAFNLASAADGDRFLFKKGTTQVISTAFKSVRQGTAAARGYYGVYGTSSIPYAKFTNPTGAGSIVLNLGGKSYLDVEDLFFDATNCATGVYAAAQSANNSSYNRFRRCTFINASTNGLAMARESTATGSVFGNLVEYCEAYNNGSHGIFLSGTGTVIRRNKTHHNGATNSQGGHGISLQYRCTDVTSGWTLTGGTTYSRAVNAAEVLVYRVSAPSPYGYMTQNTATPTTPALGEWGFVAGSPGTLYINIGATPAGASIRYGWGLCNNNVIEFNESWLNKYNPSSSYHEGHGIALDDFTSECVVRGNYCHHNEGLGLSNNKGNNNVFSGNVATDNWQSGFTANPCSTVQVVNNTFLRNNIGTDAHDAEINFNEGCISCTVSNNIAVAGSSIGSTYGVDIDPASTGFTGATNVLNGFSTAVRTATFTGTITTSPAPYMTQDGGLIYSVSSPLVSGGTYVKGVLLRNGRMRPNVTPIGAYAAVLPRTARS